ncbi:hypothetical protein BDBG_05627 [Blastomyces gilchristii SLH14081]|uniref:Muramidase n=1 Tax=Blastomyces gilchristii (strain SLH14081) TaxID=559298 RepID=A0A179UPD5_BLAGS|nr:uncharacterized protein BDBG_05627 [Blastomyces gilchristii SLH14081]OAT09935.1 hypothetical protein BDBG_05627 [Blastomyces gilchristii SLH14081]
MKKVEWTRSLQAKHVHPGVFASHPTASSEAKQPHFHLRSFTAGHIAASIPPPPQLVSSPITIPSHAENIRDHLRDFKHDRWGWVIYRCTYSDDNAWARFQQIINERSRQRMAEPDVPPEVANNLEWKLVSDPTTLDGASRDQLRARFRTWAAEARATGKHLFDWLEITAEALWSVVEGDPDDTLDGSWVHLVRAGDHDFDRSAKAEEDEDDGEVEDEGWMMIAAYTIGPDFYDVIGPEPEAWYKLFLLAPAWICCLLILSYNG